MFHPSFSVRGSIDRNLRTQFPFIGLNFLSLDFRGLRAQGVGKSTQELLQRFIPLLMSPMGEQLDGLEPDSTSRVLLTLSAEMAESA